ncbi:MAG TPA: hypothetical protein VIL79_12055 [Thermoleophilia bacterium]
MFLAHHGKATMGEDDPDDRRVVNVKLAGRAEGYADTLLAQWREQLEAVFALYPGIDPETLVAFLRTLIKQLKGRSEP